MLFDHHDDIVVLDAPRDTTQMEFYQIKSNGSKHWTLRSLIYREKNPQGEPLSSICGNMYAHKLTFGAAVKTLNFISVVPFSVRLKPSNQKAVVDHFTLDQLSEEDALEYRTAIQKEHSLDVPPVCDAQTTFSRSEIILQSQRQHALCALVDFLDRRYPDAKIAVKAAFRAILDTIRCKACYEGPLTTTDDLLAYKALTRTAFEQYLTDIERNSTCASDWALVQGMLTKEEFPASDIHKWRRAWTKYNMQRLDVASFAYAKLRHTCTQELGVYVQQNSRYTLRDVLATCAPAVVSALGASNPFSREYIEAALLYELQSAE